MKAFAVAIGLILAVAAGVFVGLRWHDVAKAKDISDSIEKQKEFQEKTDVLKAEQSLEPARLEMLNGLRSRGLIDMVSCGNLKLWVTAAFEKLPATEQEYYASETLAHCLSGDTYRSAAHLDLMDVATSTVFATFDFESGLKAAR